MVFRPLQKLGSDSETLCVYTISKEIFKFQRKVKKKFSKDPENKQFFLLKRNSNLKSKKNSKKNGSKKKKKFSCLRLWSNKVSIIQILIQDFGLLQANFRILDRAEYSSQSLWAQGGKEMESPPSYMVYEP